jgi:porphobilinogen synthase
MSLDLSIRPRRLRKSAAIRSLVCENRLQKENLIYPLFVHDLAEDHEVGSMPGVLRRSLDSLVAECVAAKVAGLNAVAIFPCLDHALKDPVGQAAFDPGGLIFRAIRAVKNAVPELAIVTDVALDPFTDHGHDGVLTADRAGVANDETVEVLCQLAIMEAEAGADIVAPSDMMDGRIGAIRAALDAAGHEETLILAYSVKYASAYYGPFRDAVGSKIGKDTISKATYQMDPANLREALREAALDEAEGADIVMVKPAGPCLDVIRAVKESSSVPVAAYQVSGEYSQIHAAARLGWLDYRRTRDESLTAIRRAGADMILTYFAREIAEEGIFLS